MYFAPNIICARAWHCGDKKCVQMFSRGKSKEKNPRGRTKHGFEYIRRGITGIGLQDVDSGQRDKELTLLNTILNLQFP